MSQNVINDSIMLVNLGKYVLYIQQRVLIGCSTAVSFRCLEERNKNIPEIVIFCIFKKAVKDPKKVSVMWLAICLSPSALWKSEESNQLRSATATRYSIKSYTVYRWKPDPLFFMQELICNTKCHFPLKSIKYYH